MKKVLSIVLSAVMLLSCLPFAGTALAEETDEVTITLAAIAGEEFIAAPEEVVVSADLSDRYAGDIGYNDTLSVPSVLDAAIAAHLAYMGDDFMDFAPLQVASNGWITDFFGMGANLTYWQNNVNLFSLDTALENDAYVAFCLYSDTTNWSDLYVYADAFRKDDLVGSEVTFTFKAVGWGEPMAAAGLDVVIDDAVVGQTDENGSFTYTFDYVGEYTVTAVGKIDDAPIFKPWCIVNIRSELLDYINRQVQEGGDYLTSADTAFEVRDAVKLATLALEDYDISTYMEGFAESVEANVVANNGKLISPYSKKEDLGLYGAVIIALTAGDRDPSDIGGYDLFEAFDKADIAEARTFHPYYYRFAILVATDEKAEAICQDFIDNYYTMGKGMCFDKTKPFYCCDNTSHFLIAIADYADAFEDYVEDAKAVIQHYTEEDGVRNDDGGMVPDVNADSTALAMGAYAALGDFDTAFRYYKNLVEGFENTPGVFMTDGEDNYFATADAAVGLAYFKREVEDGGWEHPEHVGPTVTTPATYDAAGCILKNCVICGETEETEIPKLVKNGWFKENGSWYYYKDDVAQKYWQPVDGQWYYLNSKGVMVTGWLQADGVWYYLSNSGAMVTGWQKIQNVWYYFNASGAMQTGWRYLSGTWYYLSSSGAMATGWQWIGNAWYHFNNSGAMQTGWLYDSGKWYYLESSGAMLANTSQRIGGKTYRFNSSGVCTNP